MMDAEDMEVAEDILAKFRETKQLYIVGHDTPISVSTVIFNRLDKLRQHIATAKCVPENQMEFEDVIGYITGLQHFTPSEQNILNVIIANKGLS